MAYFQHLCEHTPKTARQVDHWSPLSVEPGGVAQYDLLTNSCLGLVEAGSKPLLMTETSQLDVLAEELLGERVRVILGYVAKADAAPSKGFNLLAVGDNKLVKLGPPVDAHQYHQSVSTTSGTPSTKLPPVACQQSTRRRGRGPHWASHNLCPQGACGMDSRNHVDM